jgi:TonB family protein
MKRASARPKGEFVFRSARFAAVLLILLLGFAMLASAETRVATDDALRAAKQLKIVGRVVVDVRVEADGNVESVKIVSGNAMLTQSVIAAVKKWKFTPFQQDGAATKAIASLDFDFKM